MCLSFGYNRNEDIEDYNSAQTLVLMLIDVVSQGGNLCLNVGPNAAGEIPVIMQERLLQMGEWLEANGEAIYGTHKWDRAVQWSEGDREYDFESMYKSYVEGEYILLQTVQPIPGKARKEAFFTQKEGRIYVFLPEWSGEKFLIKDLSLTKKAQLTLLANDQALSWRQKGKDVEVSLPSLDPSEWPETHRYAYVIRIRP